MLGLWEWNSAAVTVIWSGQGHSGQVASLQDDGQG